MDIDIERYRSYLEPKEDSFGYIVKSESTPEDIFNELRDIAAIVNEYYKQEFITIV